MTDDDVVDDDGGFWRKILLTLYRSCCFFCSNIMRLQEVISKSTVKYVTGQQIAS